jgi:formylglycine-generating enzyme required for sulfatase activity
LPNHFSRTLIIIVASLITGPASAYASFRDCATCPEMVVIPAGHFRMGAKPAADGQDDFPQGPKISAPARDVDITRSFAAAKYDVTRDEYAAFVRETGRVSRDGCYVWQRGFFVDDRTRSWRNPGFPQTGRDPVVCVSWEDAQAYLRWLNGKVGGELYRLWSWEEAEYAASGGAATAYAWGDHPSRDHANYGADQCLPCRAQRAGRDRWLHTSPVGSFPANGFGLYDTAGNVWQWTDACWPDYPPPLQCRYGAVRGGAWQMNPEYLQVAEYNVLDRFNRNNSTGFRVARTLEPGTTFRDCPQCPEMIVVPPGRFNLAVESPEINAFSGAKGDRHPIQISIPRAFAVGIYDVTRDEYAAFVHESRRSGGEGCQILDTNRWHTDAATTWRHPGFPQTGRDPVVCVSWDDAQAYVKWLNGKVTGAPYRLLSGSEWDYVARGGAVDATPYYRGSQMTHDDANYGVDECWPCGVAKRGRDRWYYTSPVGSFTPNVFGVYDALGNVWQWTDDCYGEDCNIRTLRGGSYNDMPLALQISARNPFRTHVRNNANGFRVARVIP